MENSIDKEKRKQQVIKDLITLGSNISGGTAGGLLALIGAGPIGAMIGGVSTAIITHVIGKVSLEIKDRHLAQREVQRIGATLTFAIQKIIENQKEGIRLRDDDFFDESINDRSTADEIFEGVLISAQREYEEKKLRFFGNLFANIAYDNRISRSYADMLIKIAQKLTYRQLCLLRVFSGDFEHLLRKEHYREYGKFPWELIGILNEAYALYLNSLISNGSAAMLSLTDLMPAKVRLQGIGAMLYDLMELDDINSSDYDGIIRILCK